MLQKISLIDNLIMLMLIETNVDILNIGRQSIFSND